MNLSADRTIAQDMAGPTLSMKLRERRLVKSRRVLMVEFAVPSGTES
jgi:hypothetical protein